MADAVLFEFLHTEMVAELWAPDPDPGLGVSGTPWPRGGEAGCDRALWQVIAEAERVDSGQGAQLSSRPRPGAPLIIRVIGCYWAQMRTRLTTHLVCNSTS